MILVSYRKAMVTENIPVCKTDKIRCNLLLVNEYIYRGTGTTGYSRIFVDQYMNCFID